MLQPFRFQFIAMTVPCELLIIDDNRQRAEQLAQQAHARTRQLEKKYNFHQPDSWLSRVLNRRSGSRVKLDAETRQLLGQVYQLSEKTAGVFDITVGTLNHAARRNPEASLDALKQTLAPTMGLNAWHLEGRYLHCEHPETCFDLGGVVKEFAVDEAAQIVQKARGGSLVSFGGDMRMAGHKADGSPFTIGVRDPHNTQANLATLAIENASVATSGSYERQQTFGGEAHDHILARDDAASSRALSTTVIADSALEAGIYATSLMLQPTLNVPSGLKHLIVTKDRKIYSNINAD